MKAKEKSQKAGLKFNIQETKIVASGPITSCHKKLGKQWKQTLDRIYFEGAPKSLQMVTAAVKLKGAFSLEEMTNIDSILKSQRHIFANQGPSSQSYGFSSSHVWI